MSDNTGQYKLVFKPSVVCPISFPESSFPLASGRETRALGATILNNKGNNRILPIQFHCAVCIYGNLKWLLQELSFSDRWSRGTRTLATRFLYAFPPSRPFDLRWNLKLRYLSLFEVSVGRWYRDRHPGDC